MKKRITVFVVFIMTMVFCLALTGCGQNTNKQDATTNESHPGENFDTGDSSIMDGTNNPGGIVQSDDDSYADDAAKDREDSSTNNDDNSDTNRNADGTPVGRSADKLLPQKSTSETISMVEVGTSRRCLKSWVILRLKRTVE